jgi:hypothetical protein
MSVIKEKRSTESKKISFSCLVFTRLIYRGCVMAAESHGNYKIRKSLRIIYLYRWLFAELSIVYHFNKWIYYLKMFRLDLFYTFL